MRLEPTQPGASSVRYCHACGEPVDAASRFCASCGTGLAQVAVDAPARELPTSPRPQDGDWSSASSPGRKRSFFSRIAPWIAAAIVLLLVAGFAFAQSRKLSATRADLRETESSLTGEQKANADLQSRVDQLKKDNEDLRGQNGDLNSANSDLRAAAESCKKSSSASSKLLGSIADLFNGYGSIARLRSQGQAADDAAKDCESRFSSLGV